MLGGYARIDPCTAEIRADIERAWEEAERRGAKRVARLEEHLVRQPARGTLWATVVQPWAAVRTRLDTR
ncbi:MAG: hypothetical protein OXC08_00315 [Thiotrichales bacterium]|nr:hypothetical protein [Thiotrichales bacterium]